MPPILRPLIRDRRGNALMVLAAALVPLTILVGSGLDLGRTYMARAKLQHACDAAVLAGRQRMEGTVWTDDVEDEADRFFAFNFPDGAHNVTNLDFTIDQDDDDDAQLTASASADVPTIIMNMFGFDSLPISVACDAKLDIGNNDVVLVLDVTGSMLDPPSGGTGTKIARLRDGAIGIFRALAEDGESTTRFGIVPYSHTVNVARSLTNNYILASQSYVQRTIVSCGRRCTTYAYGTKTVLLKDSTWGLGGSTTDAANRTAFRTSGFGCIEERPSIGNAASPVTINDSVTRADIDDAPTSATDTARQFGIYDPATQEAESQSGCPNEASKLAEYADETTFQTAINAATASPTGGTYHDVGMLWGARFISSTGFFAADNPTEVDDVPVDKHIVFMTDGMLDTGPTLYASHGIERYQTRTLGAGTQDEDHLARFDDACDVAKAMGVTIWVIALDVGSTDDIEPCATSAGHFFTSDGSDLEDVFAAIGQGISDLRLTR